MPNYTGLDSFVVKEHRYTYETMPPVDAIPFGLEVGKLLAPCVEALTGLKGKEEKEVVRTLVAYAGKIDTQAASDLMRRALGRCYTPENKPLSDDATFNAWFGQHPGELFEAGAYAVFRLSRDFFPAALVS